MLTDRRRTADGHSMPLKTRAARSRRHGPLRSAWPRTGTAPRTRQARWLARQVGAVMPRVCAKRWRQARRRCHLRQPPAHAAAATAPLRLVRSYEIPPDDPSCNALTNWSWSAPVFRSGSRSSS